MTKVDSGGAQDAACGHDRASAARRGLSGDNTCVSGDSGGQTSGDRCVFSARGGQGCASVQAASRLSGPSRRAGFWSEKSCFSPIFAENCGGMTATRGGVGAAREGLGAALAVLLAGPDDARGSSFHSFSLSFRPFFAHFSLILLKIVGKAAVWASSSGREQRCCSDCEETSRSIFPRTFRRGKCSEK